MEDDVRDRFDDFDKRFQTLEKRFDDVKWYFGGAAAMFAVFISLFTLVANANFSNERNSLQQFKSDLRTELGKGEATPDIELLGVNGESLVGQEVTARVDKDKDGDRHIAFEYVVRNKGAGNSGLMFLKIYSKQPLQLEHSSTDESKFQYETYVNAASFTPNNIPGGNYTSIYRITMLLNAEVAPGKYPMLLKVYFGAGKVVQAPFTVSL